MGTLSITRVRKVGPVQMSSVNLVGDAGGAQRWPDESFDRLADERLFRLLVSAQLTFRHEVILAETSQHFLDFTGPDQSGSDTSSRLWERFCDVTTDDPMDLQGEETMSTVNTFQANGIMRTLTGFLIPPGFALVIGGNGTANSYTQLQTMVALSPDPFDLLPFVGARVGGIAGPQY